MFERCFNLQIDAFLFHRICKLAIENDYSIRLNKWKNKMRNSFYMVLYSKIDELIIFLE